MNKIITELDFSRQSINSTISSLHFHDGYELIYVTRGSLEIEIEKFIYHVSAPSIVIVNPFELHKIISADLHYQRYTLLLDPKQMECDMLPYLAAMIRSRPLGFSHTIHLDQNTSSYINAIFALLLNEYPNDFHYQDRLITNEICNLFILMYRHSEIKPSGQSGQMMQVQQYIDKNYSSIESVGELAGIFSMSPGHLSRSFKKYFGCSPIEYLLNTRLYHARRLLENTTDNLVEICNQIGCRDINNFIRQFKKKYGSPPQTFRKNKA